MDILQLGAAFICLYTFYAIYIGEIKGREGIHWRTYQRSDNPRKFWFMACSYLALGVFAFIALPLLKANT